MIRPLSLVASSLQAAWLLLAFTGKSGATLLGDAHMASDHVKFLFSRGFLSQQHFTDLTQSQINFGTVSIPLCRVEWKLCRN